jgi:hypothetical protein
LSEIRHVRRYVSEDTRRTAEGIWGRGEDIGGGFSALPQSLEGEGVVALGETLAGGVRDKRTVIPLRRSEAESAVEQELAGGGLDEVGTANNFGDLHGGVIDNYGELVRGNVVATPDEEVAEIAASDKILRSEMLIVEVDGFAVRHAESPVDTSGRSGEIGGLAGERAAGSGI